MTETERKALALVNEIAREIGEPPEGEYLLGDLYSEALRRLVEQHEAFRQEVSDAVEAFMPGTKHQEAYLNYAQHFARFIIAKPDPLEEVIADYKRTKGGGEYATNKDMAAALRAALAARGLKIVEVGHD